MNFIDTHCHLDFYEDFESIIENAKEAGVTKLISVGTSTLGSKKCIEIAEKYSGEDFKIYATCGIHAEEGREDLEKFGPDYVKKLGLITQSSRKVVAIGECGFDYRLTSDRQQATSDQKKKFQRELFEAQIRLANDLDLPLIIHCRHGWKESFEILKRFQGSTSKSPGVFHSWTGDWELAKKALRRGFYISFSGIVTYKNAKDVQEVVKKAPIDRILIETDSPFLSPEPLRGEKNEPKNVKIIAQFIASLRGVPQSKIASKTFENACRLFKLR